MLKFFTNLDESLMERLQREFDGVRFVKAFNSVGNACMVNPKFKSGKPTMFICGNDEAAKKAVSAILDRVRLGNGGHGQGRGGTRHRAALHALVHPRVPTQRLDSCLQATHLGRLPIVAINMNAKTGTLRRSPGCSTHTAIGGWAASMF